ncbi:MAG: hypothetical protein PHE53_02530 [Thermoguttaceae bacterium]|nr:hypothetical protein [Thermoguttaceae bacterium]
MNVFLTNQWGYWVGNAVRMRMDFGMRVWRSGREKSSPVKCTTYRGYCTIFLPTYAELTGTTIPEGATDDESMTPLLFSGAAGGT